MTIAMLGKVLKVFGGGEPDAGEQKQLFKETLLMTLARASSSDTNVETVEVDTVREILKRVTGEDISAADIRVAARSELFESTPLEKYLSRVARKLRLEDRVTILRSLAEVLRSDVTVSQLEVDYFDKIAGALDVNPAALAGLTLEGS
jgi:uncharacterized tellurite resistance protein B-like protein